ncbi:hypothetical protein KMA58_00735 [Enterococcus faecalis]|uniref:hypothetical protein n=1 Tax=Enterococcus faecalis TaxID=1351 RepID=UPI001D09F07F|nr:hypothetical protein [Enterococcus faecalis]MCB8526936.1 hypothetical protein [Enterococcus faecalis]
MLRINRIKGISKTLVGDFGFDYTLEDSLNLISSQKNTRGKSSVIATIYYCLGFEEIIGGRGMKTLTSVYKNNLVDEDNNSHIVLESEAWLELSNGTDTVTVFRAGKMDSRNENLISVYYTNFDSIHDPDVYIEDMYVHSKYSTTSQKGFHSFLEKFIGFELPYVPTSDGKEYKLYMQVLFSGIFIEQKRGWADLFSAMPIMKIKDAKKRVIEYILALDTLSNEKNRAKLKHDENDILTDWKLLINEIKTICARENCNTFGLPLTPKILENDFYESIHIKHIRDNRDLSNIIEALNDEKEALVSRIPRIVNNYEELQEELEKTDREIHEFDRMVLKYEKELSIEEDTISKLTENLDIIQSDIQNNKDALKLKNMGSNLDIESYKGFCPTCRQPIEDSLLPSQVEGQVMSIEENINHLQSQFDMISFALTGHIEKKRVLEENKRELSSKLFTLRRLAKSIRSDLYSVDEEVSESIVYKRVQIETDIQKYSSLLNDVEKNLKNLFQLSLKWKQLLVDKELLPKNNFSENDNIKIRKLEIHFKNYLKAFNYNSASDLSAISISRDTYLPISEGFDMKFDSSASDNIRAIWAYTLSLLHTSNETGGNHPKIIMFDEPAQHSIVTEDVVNLFNQVNKLPGDKQVLLGITLNDTDIRQAVSLYEKNKINVIDVGVRSFKKMHIDDQLVDNSKDTK